MFDCVCARVFGVYLLCVSCVHVCVWCICIVCMMCVCVCGFGVLLPVLCWKIASHPVSINALGVEDDLRYIVHVI